MTPTRDRVLRGRTWAAFPPLMAAVFILAMGAAQSLAACDSAKGGGGLMVADSIASLGPAGGDDTQDVASDGLGHRGGVDGAQDSGGRTHGGPDAVSPEDTSGNAGSPLDGATPADTLPTEDASDTVAVSFLSPQDGATLSGAVTVEVTVAGGSAATSVQLLLDQTPQATLDAPPFVWAFDTTLYSNGPYDLTAVATSGDGEESPPATVHVVVANPGLPQCTPPVVVITFPADGGTVCGPVTLAAALAAERGLESVEFRIDDAPVGSVEAPPYALAWNSKDAADGAHQIKVVATDTLGQEGPRNRDGDRRQRGGRVRERPGCQAHLPEGRSLPQRRRDDRRRRGRRAGVHRLRGPDRRREEAREARRGALDVCLGGLVGPATFGSPTNDAITSAWAAVSHFGDPENDLSPKAGPSYALLATGPTTGTSHSTDLPGGGSVSDPFAKDDYPAYDSAEFTVVLTAPANALGFSVDFVFFSEEYEEYVGTSFNDKFYILLTAPETTGGQTTVVNDTACSNPNTYYDTIDESGSKRCYVAIKTAYSEKCPTAPTNIAGTGYSCASSAFVDSSSTGSSTGWLRTAWPIEGGETFTLTFHIHDSSDGIYDSEVILDNFRFETEPFTPGTTTIP